MSQSASMHRFVPLTFLIVTTNQRPAKSTLHQYGMHIDQPVRNGCTFFPMTYMSMTSQNAQTDTSNNFNK